MNKELKIVIAVMLIIWFSLLTFLYMKADAITKDPCSICSMKMGENVICTTNTEFGPVRRYYYPNGTIMNDEVGVIMEVPDYGMKFTFEPVN